MIELAEALKLWKPGGSPTAGLPTGLIVGSAVIESCTEAAPSPLTPRPSPLFYYEWHLTDVQRIKTPRKPKGHPQPVWFKPF